MNNPDRFLDELFQIDDEVTLICHVFDWLRPDVPTDTDSVAAKVNTLEQLLASNSEEASVIRNRVSEFAGKLRFLPLYSDIGILPRRSFATEFRQRMFNKILPEPEIVFSAKNLMERVFSHPEDAKWVAALSDTTWLQIYRIFIPENSYPAVENHLANEALYALEMLSIWVAAEEMEDELLRLDPTIVEYDSNFIALEREVKQFVAACRSQITPTMEAQPADGAHAWIMLRQCEEQIQRFRELALSKGSDLKLTYLLERLEQTLTRISHLLGIFEAQDGIEFRKRYLTMFRELVAKLCQERSVTRLIKQTTYLLAKSVTNQASKTGEHYVTESRREYITMLIQGLGAGVFIAIMAFLKLFIVNLHLSEGWMTFWVSMNYGLGFVIIHMFHFTVATKQPAMTAAYIARKLEHANNGRVDRKELAQLVINVGRSQFAAIAGNVAAALPVAVLISFTVSTITGTAVLKPSKAMTLMQQQDPVNSLALFYAAIAGIWLFVSGLVAGYFDNRSLYLDLPGRIRHHPLLVRIIPSRLLNGLANYIDGHFGALWGNMFFGVMLGVTAYIGYLLGLPLDIRHVAFSVANVGYSATEIWPGIAVFAKFILFALLIGVVNLLVSFTLALNIAMRSRGSRLCNLGDIARAYWQEARQRPWELIVPPAEVAESKSSA